MLPLKRIKRLEESVEWLIRHSVFEGGAMDNLPASVLETIEKLRQKESCDIAPTQNKEHQ